MEAKTREQCKIRKRGNSSSSSSSLVQKYRFKRAILVGKRGGGSSTPVPTWMTTSKSPTLAMPTSEFVKGQQQHSQSGLKSKDVSVSARKLAATLWEINHIPSPSVNRKDLEVLGDKKELRSRERIARLSHLSDPSYTPISEGIDGLRGKSHRRRTSGNKKKLHVNDYSVGGGMDSVGNASLMEIETHVKGKTHVEHVLGIKTRLKDVSNGLTTSKELLKVLNRVWGHDQHHSSAMSLVSALRVELERACIHVDQLIKDQRSNRREIEFLVKHFEDERVAWKRKERERIRNAIACIGQELEVEKKLRRQTERLNKKLGKELADTKASLSRAMRELESEKRAKEILEQVCDELARGIGEDRAEVEELKRESAKVKEEVEKEREMLQLADVLREERVQMKLSEAKYHFEEKNAAVEKLRNELEAYLREKIGKEEGDGSPNYERIKELEAYLKEIKFGSHQNSERKGNEEALANGEVLDGDDSADSDLHSIELNMDNTSRSYKWSFAFEGDANDNPKPTDKDMKDRRSISEHIQRRSASLQRRNPNDTGITDWDFIGANQENLDMFSSERLDISLLSKMQDHEDEIERYRSVENLRERVLSGSKRTSTRNFTSPTRQWGESLPSQGPGSGISGSSPVLRGE